MYVKTREKSQRNRYSLGKGKREKPLVAAYPMKEFHGKTSDEQFSVVGGGVCPVSHSLPLPRSLHCSWMDQRSRAIELGTRVALGVNADGTCGLWSCKTKREPAPWLHNDGPSCFHLEEFSLWEEPDMEIELCFARRRWKRTS